MSRLAFAVCAVAALATAAHAQTAPSSSSSRPLRIGFAGGVTVPRTGASAATLKSGVHGQGFVQLKLGALPSLRFNVDYAHMQFDRGSLSGLPTLPGTAGATAAPAEADRTMLDGVMSLKLDLLKGPVRPYVLAGVGAFNVKDMLDSAAAGSTDRSFRTTNLGLDGGAGVSLKLGPIDAFVETRLQNVYTKQQGFVNTKSITAFPVAFGLSF